MGRLEVAESTLPRTSSAELPRQTLLACKAQDPRAFREFVLFHQRGVFALVSRVLGSGPHVEDVAQEVFLRAYRAFPAFDLDGAARSSTWLLTIAVRMALNARRNLARAPRPSPIVDATELAHPSTPETERAKHELGLAIATAAAELSDDQRAAFVLSELHGMSIADVARALDVPENTIKTRLFRAREHMRERLARFEKGFVR